MRLYELFPRALNLSRGPFDGIHQDFLQNVVVRAKDAKQARKLAATEAGVEGAEAWLNPNWTVCQQLSQDGKPEVICKDFFGV